MNVPSIIFLIVTGCFLLYSRREWAALPLLIGSTYMTLGQQMMIGPFHFTVIRMLIGIGMIRVVVRRERLSGGWTKLDKIVVAWGIWAMLSSFFHAEPDSALIYRLGLVYNGWGLYFLLRIFIRRADGILMLGKITVILLAPIALEMLLESVTGTNRFSIFGGLGAACEVRNGAVRAQGPFAHPILAGTVGAICLPIAFLLWQKRHYLIAIVGFGATGLIVVCSRSSGPIMTAFFGIVGLFAWNFRQYMRAIRWSILLGLGCLSLVMNAPIYYLIGRINLTGSSTGYHRAALIESAFKHLGEWWFSGTDYTRHWMPTGVGWSEAHTDITNHYLYMGVLGGLPLMGLFIWILAEGFTAAGRGLRSIRTAPVDEQFTLWTLGSILFAHAATMMSISLFDQSIIFFYLTLAAIGSLAVSSTARVPVRAPQKRTQTHVPAHV